VKGFNQIQFDKIKTIFFDYDGTLHNSIKIYAPAFIKAYDFLVENKLAEPKIWRTEEISYWLGYNSEEMWKAFMPKLSVDLRKTCSEIIGAEMKLQIERGLPILYEGALETLVYLKNKGYTLVFISNCRIYYRDAHNKLFNLHDYFDDLICSEEYDYVPKHEILKKVKNKYPGGMVIIGDRMQDIEAGWMNDIYTIGCKYGFALEGELDKADIIIEKIEDLKKIL
jgi:phosphoglycolate phosphatase